MGMKWMKNKRMTKRSKSRRESKENQKRYHYYFFNRYENRNNMHKLMIRRIDKSNSLQKELKDVRRSNFN